MMLNVSRTPVSESWLSTLPVKASVGYNALDKKALVTMEKSRFSVSTIDSELFPELLSWSALVNTLPTPSYAQSIPSDISQLGDTDTVHEIDSMHEADPSLSTILDPTTLEVGFDQSCFDGLDHLLIHHPFEAFAQAFWLDAVAPPSPSLRASTPSQILNKPTGSRKLPPLPLTIPILEEPEVNVDESYHPCSAPRSPWSATDETLSWISNDDDQATSFILFEAPLLTPNRYDSVGHFPMPSSRPHVSPHFVQICRQVSPP